MAVHLKDLLQNALTRAVDALLQQKGTAKPEGYSIRIEIPPQYSMGHYATPCALELAKILKQNPRQIALELVETIKDQGNDFLAEIKVEGPGFLNFFLAENFLLQLLAQDFDPNRNLEQLRSQSENRHTKINFEFVSANPTGPLNIVSARAASVGDTICRILEQAGFQVDREYYVNDYGNQLRLLGISVAYRYLQSLGLDVQLPEDGYQGNYVIEVAKVLAAAPDFDSTLKLTDLKVIQETDKLNAWLERAGEYFGSRAAHYLLSTQKRDLADFKVNFNRFFLESSLHQEGKVENAFVKLKETGHLYLQDGAWFFASMKFGDDKDRVVMRSDGRPTYLMADIAYHYDKIQRGYDRIINIWGPDHHGYIARLRGAVTALGYTGSFEVLIVQQVNLLENGQPLVMSKRLGQFQTMADLVKEIPHDAARYFFVTRSSNTHLDFDLALAREQSNKNPVFYVEYAHARIHSVFRELQLDFDSFLLSGDEIRDMGEFIRQHERQKLFYYNLRLPDEIFDIARSLDFHRLTTYLYELATVFTSFYSQRENRIKDLYAENPSQARLLLAICKVTARTLEYGLSLLSISAPRKM